MKKLFYLFTKKRKRGITIIETVIALTVISIISAAAITMVMASTRAEAKSVNSIHITIEAKNAVECFRYADNTDEMLDLLKKTNNAYIKNASDRLVLSKASYELTVYPDFMTNNIEIYALNSNGDEIYRLNYQKG